uniref:Uncharacterized protein n=1 Tax=Arundo donax TaxID=35708 RepID=A0A0A9AM06_ARUDO
MRRTTHLQYDCWRCIGYSGLAGLEIWCLDLPEGFIQPYLTPLRSRLRS